MNIGEATKKMFQAKGKVLREVFNLYNNCAQSKLPQKPERQVGASPSQIDEAGPAGINPAKQHKFEKVKELHGKGYSI